MKTLVGILALVLFNSMVAARQNPPSTPAPPAVQTEQVGTSATPPAAVNPQAMQPGEGFMEPAQVKDLLHRLWLAEYRINDLLTEVHPDQWKLPETARGSFLDTFDALRKQMAALESWRGQLDTRPDSMYLGYMTHASIDAILPRLDAVTQIVTKHENASLGAQFSQAGNVLFDLQQRLQPYLVYLLRNQDQLLYATENNLASCQNQLGLAKRSETPRATPMKNIIPEFKGRRVRKHAAAAGASGTPEKAAPQPSKKK